MSKIPTLKIELEEHYKGEANFVFSAASE